MRQLLVVLGAAVLCTVALHSSAQSSATRSIDFARDVQPILREHCYECHGSDKQMNGFRLDRRRDALRGGTLPVIAPGSAAASRMYLRLVGTAYGRRMPLDKDSLTPPQIDAIKTWIDQGAVWPDDVSGDVTVAPPDPDGVKAFAAIRAGDRNGFLAALRGKDVSTLRGPGGATPLMAAALYGDAALVAALLDRGAAPNVANDAGATALMWAANDLEKARLLLDKGANPNLKSNDGRTPLIVAAAFRGNRAVVALLLDRGASPSMQAPGLVAPLTAITEAAKQGDEPTIRLLVERGSDVARASFPALGFALRARCDGCVEAIAARLPKPLFTPALALAAPPLGPALATVPLLERGADPNVRNPAGYPMILLASASEAMPVDAVKALLARGADVNAANPFGETALSVARRNGRTPVVDALLQAGATAPPADVPQLVPSRAVSVAAAIARTLPLLQRADVAFMRTAGCVSCHNNSQTAMTLALARANGHSVDEAVAAEQQRKTAAYVEEWRERVLLMQGIPGDSDTMSTVLLGLAAQRHAPDWATEAMARFIRYQQAPDGHWIVFAHRPPIESGDVQETTDALAALRVYGTGAERRASEAAIARGEAWLLQARPDTFAERAHLLLGLRDAHAPKPSLTSAAAALLAQQRPDGGWAQLPTLESDAYATGLAITALLRSGVIQAKHPAIASGVEFLMKNQLADGSWYVARRAIPIQPYFDAGFPHGRDQFISAAATNWATQALILSGNRTQRRMTIGE